MRASPESVATTRAPYILAIDLGTSACKVGLVSAQGRVLATESEEMRVILLPNGGAEQDPADWWRAITRAARRLLARGLVPVEDIVAVSCTGQWSGTVAVDREGRPLMNAIIWMDARGAPYIRRITGGLISVEGYGLGRLWTWIRLTGGVPTHVGKDPIAHILYIKHQHPEVYRATYKFLEPKDYLNLRLTGKFAASYDAITLHWVTDNRDISRVTYSDRLLRMATLDREKLPDLKRAVDVLSPLRPEVAEELGLRQDVQVVVGTPDVQSAAIGSGAVRDFQAHLYIGTSSWLTCHVPFKKTDLFHNMASLPSAIPGRYFVANEQETAGACLTFLRDNILYHDDELTTGTKPDDAYRLFDRVVERVPPGSGGVIFTPWLYGERTPVDDPHVRGGFHNLSLDTTRGHLVRAVFEGVAYNARWLLHYLEKFVGRHLDNIHMVGGGANSDVWCQVHADVLNRTVRQVKDPVEANVRGAAIVAAVALGFTTFDQVAGQVEIASTYRPNPAYRELYDALFREFVALYKRNRKMYERLNRGVGEHTGRE